MKDIFLRFIYTRDWLGIFIKFSAIMFWFHVAIIIGIVIFRPMREMFLDWVVLNNSDYFTIITKDIPVLDSELKMI